jgi:hypothetical protein
MYISSKLPHFLFAIFIVLFLGAAKGESYSPKLEQLVEDGTFGRYKALLLVPEKPTALLLIFAGYDGVLRLSGTNGNVKFGTDLNENFLVRSRGLFFDQSLALLIVDAPNSRPLDLGSRESAAAEILRLVDKSRDLAPSIKQLPLWAVGTSNGTVSAAALAVTKPDSIAGLVLSATITRPYSGGGYWFSSHPLGVASMQLADFKKHVFIQANQGDQCNSTPAKDSELLAAKFSGSSRAKFQVLSSSKTEPGYDPCDALTPHGNYGIESAAVSAIAEFISASP